MQHCETRADNKTPSIVHQLSQVSYTISQLAAEVHIENPEAVITINITHDLGEDFGLKPKGLKLYSLDKNISDSPQLNVICSDFNTITKKYDGEERQYANENDYYNAQKDSENCSLAKLYDTIHNLATQVSVMSREKCVERILEIRVILNDYINDVTERYPAQEQAYKSCQTMLNTLCQIGSYQIVYDKTGKPLPSIDDIKEEEPQTGFALPPGLDPIALSVSRILKQLQSLPHPNSPARSCSAA